ncbi:MAG: hypothetical protein MUE50_16135, partial [Pirellulaceae bacterium]|nr:hypothetical protein [Pirellulaceae bacterium]
LVQLLDVDADVSRKFGELDAYLLDRGLVVTDIDLLNAATAQVHDCGDAQRAGFRQCSRPSCGRLAQSVIECSVDRKPR